MSTTTQLESWAAKNIPHFLGVFAADTLPHPEVAADTTYHAPTSLVVNYDPHEMSGSHWVACRIRRHEVEWFDSFGLAPDADDLILGHKTRFREWLGVVCHRLGLTGFSWNTADLQALSGRTCGHYAVWFARNGPKKGWEGFGPHREANDRAIQRLVQL